MRKAILTIVITCTTLVMCSQSDLVSTYQKGLKLLKDDKVQDAYTIFKEVEAKCDQKDTLYDYVLFYYVNAASELEKQNRLNEKFDVSLKYGLEAMDLIEKGKPHFDERFALREYWMHKNIIVSYFGLNQLDKAQKHRDILYKAYKEKKLPEGMDEYYNFSYYTWEGKNVWGYEWFEELPEDRFSKSFSKVVYYVYSTKADGSDNEQLYRLHVLMFHNIDPEVKIDYVLTKRLDQAKQEVSGTLYQYTYTKDLDFGKLQKDIREVLKGNYEPNTKSINKK